LPSAEYLALFVDAVGDSTLAVWLAEPLEKITRWMYSVHDQSPKRLMRQMVLCDFTQLVFRVMGFLAVV
jgi:hypothetical protein